MADALIAIDECVIRHQSKSQGRSLLEDRGMQVGAVEGRLGLGQRGLEQAEVTDTTGATGLGQQPQAPSNTPLQPTSGGAGRGRSRLSGKR